MSITRRNVTIGGTSLLASASISSSEPRRSPGELLGVGEGIEDFILATDAYIYGYPLVTMEMTRRVFTNVARLSARAAPMGQIIKACGSIQMHHSGMSQRRMPIHFTRRCSSMSARSHA